MTLETFRSDASTYVRHTRTGEWKPMEVWVDEYVIGSEGASAWVWRGDSPSPMHLLGFTGTTRQEAIKSVLAAIWESEGE